MSKCGTCGRYASGMCLLMECETAENKAACPEYIEGKRQTCGECKYFNPKRTFDYPPNRNVRECTGGFYKGSFVAPDAPCCPDFKPKPTNGDVIRRGGNRKLAIFHMWNTCDTCVYSNKSKSHNDICHCPVDKTCVDGIEAWLNAPAESEGEDD